VVIAGDTLLDAAGHCATGDCDEPRFPAAAQGYGSLRR
jgi:hypothetical protein